MTAIPRAALGMSIDQAVEVIHHHGHRWHSAPEHLTPKPSASGTRYNCSSLDYTKANARQWLDEAVRDCGWCIAHQDGNRGLQALFKAVLKGTKEPYRYDINRVMDHAFHGIDGWMA